MGGQIQVQSTPDCGSVFWFELAVPLAGVRVTDAPETSLPESSVPPEAEPWPTIPPPPDILRELLAQAQDGDMGTLREQLALLEQRAPEWQPFVHRLHALAQQFDDQTIIALLEQALEPR
jgi:hypothetical protein